MSYDILQRIALSKPACINSFSNRTSFIANPLNFGWRCDINEEPNFIEMQRFWFESLKYRPCCQTNSWWYGVRAVIRITTDAFHRERLEGNFRYTWGQFMHIHRHTIHSCLFSFHWLSLGLRVTSQCHHCNKKMRMHKLFNRRKADCQLTKNTHAKA